MALKMLLFPQQHRFSSDKKTKNPGARTRAKVRAEATWSPDPKFEYNLLFRFIFLGAHIVLVTFDVEEERGEDVGGL